MDINEDFIKKVVGEVIEKITECTDFVSPGGNKKNRIPINISNRHIHIKREHLDVLFGKGYELTKLRDLMQPGEFATNELVTIVGPSGVIRGARILGPLREYTQVELSLTDTFSLGIEGTEVRDSGVHSGTPGMTLVGPVGSVTIKEGVILAGRHIHMHTTDGEKYGFKNGDYAMVRVEGQRALIFEKVLVRVKSNYLLEMHIDTDEANACALKPGGSGYIV